ncbi:MAG: hypothetical protein DVB31_11370, partial [Verrucomicrobia bacterium]
MTRTGSQVRGSIKPGQEIWVRGDSRGAHTTLVFPDGMTNHGVLRLRSADGGYVSSVSVPSGGMFNAADGQLLVEAGAAGPRTLAGPLVNEGWVSINWPATLVFAGATHVNRGEFDVMPGMALGISGQGQTFRQEAGRIRFDGGADLTGIVFDWVGGTLVGSPLLDGVDLRVAPGVTQPFSLSLIRSSSQFTGELKTGQTLWVRGDSRGYHMMLGLPDDFSDAGLLLLESRDGGYQSGVRVGSGNLTVQPGGILRAGVGAGGPRPIDAALLNRGRVEANLSVTLGRAGLKHRNEGEFVVAPGAALGFSGTGQTFEQAGGFLQIDGSATLRDQTFRYLGGLVKGQIYMANDTLEFGPGAGPSGTFLTGGSGMRLSGRIPSGATVIVQGSSDAYHTLEVAPNGLGIDGVLQLVSRDGGYNSALRVDGAPLAIGVGGLLQFSAGSGGPRSVTGEVRSAGKIRADFSATLGQAATPVLSTGEIAVAAGVTLTLPGGVQAGGGRIEGAGAIVGSVLGNATVAPGPGLAVLSVNGDFVQGAQGTLEFEIGGKTPGTGYDQLVLTRPAQLAGTVRLVLANGFVPSAGDRFQLVSGPPASTIGTRFELPKLPAGLSWNIGVAGGLAFSVEAAQPAAGQFVGRVSDGDGHPVPGVTVQASQTTPYGLRAQLWNNATLSGTPLVERFDAQIDNNWGGGVPDAGIPADNFSVRWTGFVVPRFTETYAFHTISDDGVRLWI